MGFFPYWQLAASVITVAFCGAVLAREEDEKPLPGPGAVQFRQYLGSFAVVAPKAVSVEVCRLAEKAVLRDVVLSPDGMFITVISAREGRSEDQEVLFVEVGTRRQIALFRPIPGNDVRLVPVKVRWSPDSKELYLGYRFSDLQVGNFWFRWDMKTGQFTDTAQEELRKLGALHPSQRPDALSHPKGLGYGYGPTWTLDGRKFENLGRGEYAKLTEEEREWPLVWQAPHFLGSDRDLLNLDLKLHGKTVYEILLETQSIPGDDGRRHFRAHVVCGGQFVETFQAPCAFVFGRLLFEYRSGDIWVYNRWSQNEEWKTNLGNVRVDAMFDLSKVKGRKNGNAILVLAENGQTTVRLILDGGPRPVSGDEK